MKFTLLTTITCLISALSALPAGETEASLPTGNYFVKLRRGSSQQQVKTFLQDFNRNSVPEGTSDEDVSSFKYTYNPKFLNAFAGRFTADFLKELRTKFGRDIEYIERDGVVRALDVQKDAPAWGLPRISDRKKTDKKDYTYPSQAGEGIDAWIIDTGVQANHTAFEGRAKAVISFVKNEENTDLNGHGTHCAGTIGSGLYGVAKKVNIFGVKVLNAYGSGSWSDVVAGIEYVAKNGRKGKSVINMSLGGGKTQTVDDAVKAAKAAGVVVIVAAGNNNGDACSLSPAGAPDAFAVGASDVNDTKASFSNFGKCVKVFAPGVNVLSTWKGPDGKATNSISGTSMASPHVAGVAALYLSMNNYNSVDEVYNDLVSFSTAGVIKGLDANTANRFVFNHRVKSEDDNGATQPPVPTPSG
jgi:subtilisin family serine protease